MSPNQRSALEDVRDWTVERGRCEASYRRAVLAAVEAGVSYADVGRAAGVSRQAVRQLVVREREKGAVR